MPKRPLGREVFCTHCGRPYRRRRVSSRYCSRPCSWANNGGQNRKPETWWLNSRGYIEGRIWTGETQRRVKRHVYVMEQQLDRRLRRGENVHHINGTKTDNRLENLQLMSHADHNRHHHKARALLRDLQWDQ